MRLIDADALVKCVNKIFGLKPDARWSHGAVLNTIDAAPTISEWISVKDRLPENCDTVLIAHKGGVSFGWYNGRYWERGASTKHREIRTVSHWMPLPKAPEGSEPNENTL